MTAHSLATLALVLGSCSTPSPDRVTPDAGTSADAGTTGSGGHGGLACDATGSVTANGVRYAFCVAKVAGVELKIVEPVNAEAPLRLAVYLHGDGAGPHDSGFALRSHAPWTTTHRTLYVSAKAPNGCAWWLRPGYTTCDGETAVPDSAIDRAGDNAAALEQVLEALRGGWDLADAPILFGGSSGGSIFLSSSFLPTYGDRYEGVYALSCGGDVPWAGHLAWEASDQALLGATRLFFTYGDKDFLVPQIERGVAFYEGLSVPTAVKVVPESGAPASSHCGNVGGSYSYDQIGRIAEVWASVVGG